MSILLSVPACVSGTDSIAELFKHSKDTMGVSEHAFVVHLFECA